MTVGTLEVYRDDGEKWRWRLRARNGRIRAVSGESFASKSNAVRAARDLAADFRFGDKSAGELVGVEVTQ